MYALLALINFLTLKDHRSRRVVAGVAYGPHSRQRLDIYAPKSGSGPWPVIYFLYGGSWSLGERGYYEFMGRCLAALGFVVVIADYRLVPEVEYPVFLDDCAAGLAWVATHIADHGGDPSRLIVMGHSAGAYNAVMVVLASVLPAGVAEHIRAVVGLSGPYDFYPFDVAITLRVFGGVDDPKATQPLSHIRPNLPPMFLGTGDSDTLVYPRNTVALAAGLRESGNSVVEKHYPGVGHPGTLLALGSYRRRGSPILADLKAFLRSVI